MYNLYVYELIDKLLRTINKDQSGQKIFFTVCHLTVSNNDSIHVADYNNGMITLDTQGQVLWKYSGSDLKRVYGVCADGCGNVFVCGCSLHNVLQIRHNGHRLGDFVNKIHGLIQHLCGLTRRIAD